jgi:DNA-binding XRE family transcriptional regulator
MTVKPMDKSRLPYYPDCADSRSSESIECKICGRILAGRVGYITHHHRCHAGNTPAWTYTGGKPDNPRNIPYAQGIITKGAKICKLCGHQVNSITGMTKHFSVHHKEHKPTGNYYILAAVKIDGGNITIKPLRPKRKPADNATLKQIRGLRGLSQSMASKNIGEILGRKFQYQTLQHFEQGDSCNPTLEIIETLAKTYGVSESEIIAAFRASVKSVAQSKTEEVQ